MFPLGLLAADRLAAVPVVISDRAAALRACGRSRLPINQDPFGPVLGRPAAVTLDHRRSAAPRSDRVLVERRDLVPIGALRASLARTVSVISVSNEYAQIRLMTAVPRCYLGRSVRSSLSEAPALDQLAGNSSSARSTTGSSSNSPSACSIRAHRGPLGILGRTRVSHPLRAQRDPPTTYPCFSAGFAYSISEDAVDQRRGHVDRRPPRPRRSAS